MKKLIAVFPALTLCLGLCADNVFTDFLSRLDSLNVSFDYTFEVKGPVPLAGQGSVLMQGDCYRLTSEGLRIWSDGSVRYVADDISKELYIESIAGSDSNTNPMMNLKNTDRESVVEGVDVLFNGRRVQSFSINPSDSAKFKSVSVFFYGKNIVGAEFVDRDGTRTVFKISNFLFRKDRLPASEFSCELSEFNKEYQIIDMLSD